MFIYFHFPLIPQRESSFDNTTLFLFTLRKLILQGHFLVFVRKCWRMSRKGLNVKAGGHDKVLRKGGRGRDYKFTGMGMKKMFSGRGFGEGDILERVVCEKN